MKRLCFLSPDPEHAKRVVDDLKSSGIPEKHIYALAKFGMDVEGLPDAGPEADDFLPGYERGLALGGTTGVLAGLTALAFPPAGFVVGGGLVVLLGLFSAGVGGLLTGIFGAAYENSRLQKFQDSLDQGNILILVDVPVDQVERYEALIKKQDPEVEVEGIEPPTPFIP